MRRSDDRPESAKVYPVVPNARAWVVEAPCNGASTQGRVTTFIGEAALPQAIEYACRTYGATSCFFR